jgi:yecA family protein
MGVGARAEQHRTDRSVMGAATKPAFSYDELDEYLRGGGHHDAVGMSAIDGLIAALVAAPVFVHPDEWLPLIFGGRRPRMREGSAELRAMQAIFKRYNEVSTTLAERPHDYCPIFMIDDHDEIVVNPWAAGFILGIALRQEAWAASILLTPHRSLLVPILVHHKLGGRLVPDVMSAEPQKRRADAHHQIPQAVVAIRRICNPRRAAEAEPIPGGVRTAGRHKR